RKRAACASSPRQAGSDKTAEAERRRDPHRIGHGAGFTVEGRGRSMTAAASRVETVSTEYRRAITAGVIGNVLEWYDFGVYGYLVPTISALFFPSGDPTVSLLLTFAVFGVGFVMRPVGSIVFGIYGDRKGRRKALSAVIFVMAISTFV